MTGMSVDLSLRGSPPRNDIIYFEVKQQETTYFPNNIGNLFNNLKYVLNENSGLKFIARKNFGSMRKVLEMSLAHNLITGIPFDSFYDLVNVEKLYFHFNRLKSFHKDTFINNRNLQHVYAYANEIEFLQAELFSKNDKLVGIHFDHNKIKQIDLIFTPQFTRINFKSNICIDKVFPDDIRLNEMIEEIKNKC